MGHRQRGTRLATSPFCHWAPVTFSVAIPTLPPLLHIHAEAGHPLEWLRWTAHFLVEKVRGRNLGACHLLDVLFVQGVRVGGEESSPNFGWLTGLTGCA